MANDKKKVRAVLDKVKADGRPSLTAPEGKIVCDAYGIPSPKEGLATSARHAATLAKKIGFPVVLKIVSPDILHKTEAGGVITGLVKAAEVEKAYARIIKNAAAYKKGADILGVQVQQMLPSGAQEVMIGAISGPEGCDVSSRADDRGRSRLDARQHRGRADSSWRTRRRRGQSESAC
jgi:acyl-CoA synthetase (NDP forming)